MKCFTAILLIAIICVASIPVAPKNVDSTVADSLKDLINKVNSDTELVGKSAADANKTAHEDGHYQSKFGLFPAISTLSQPINPQFITPGAAFNTQPLGYQNNARKYVNFDGTPYNPYTVTTGFPTTGFGATGFGTTATGYNPYAANPYASTYAVNPYAVNPYASPYGYPHGPYGPYGHGGGSHGFRRHGWRSH